MFTIKELASVMSSPSVSSLHHLRKLSGFMKSVGDVGVKMQTPQPGIGKMQSGGSRSWILKSYSDADWSRNKSHRRSTSCGVHMLNCTSCGSSRSQKVISLSSCESELHSLVSCACDGIFIRACIEFALGCEMRHVVFTDNSAARQLACRQGNGKVRHLSGKVLWIQQKTQDNVLELRQVPTLENVADVGTKCLSGQRLFLLMHEIGLVYIPTFDPVGDDESSKHAARLGSKTQLKKIARALFQMSVAMGLEPVRTVVAAQKCQVMYEEKMETIWSWKWIFMCACVMVFFLLSTWFGVRRILKLESRMLQNEQEMRSVQQQLADHYDYAAELGTRADHVEETADGLAVRLVAVEEDHQEATTTWEDAMDCLRYGLIELGGFVRFNRLNRDQRSHMLAQERRNFVVWSIRNRADTTDPEIHVPDEFRDGDNG